MNHTEFFKSVKSGDIKHVYLLHGDEEYLKNAAVTALTNAVVPDFRELNITAFDAVGANELFAACDTLPFFAERRMIIVRSLPKEDDAKKIAEYLEHICDSTVLVFCIKGVADKRGVIYKKCAALSGDCLFETLKEGEASKWIAQHVKKAGCSIDSRAVSVIIGLVGCELSYLASETKKLIDLAGEGGIITVEMVRNTVIPNLETRIFDMFEYFLAGKAGDGLRSLSILIAGGDEPMRIASFLYGRLKLMHYARRLIDAGVSQQEGIKRLGGHPYAAERTWIAAKRFDELALKNAMLDFSDVAYMKISGLAKDRNVLESALIRNFALARKT